MAIHGGQLKSQNYLIQPTTFSKSPLLEKKNKNSTLFFYFSAFLPISKIKDYGMNLEKMKSAYLWWKRPQKEAQ